MVEKLCILYCLIQNSKEPYADALIDSLEEVCGKCRNVMIINPANCGEPFILNPLSVIYIYI